MRFCKLLANYFHGIRFPAIIVSLVLSVTVFVGIYTAARIQYIASDYGVVNSCANENMYYFTRLYTMEELSADIDILHNEVVQVLEECENSTVIKHIYTIQTANLFAYGDEYTSIVLMDPELLGAFPGLKHIGYDFSVDPEGCILGSKIFNDLADSETITLRVVNSEGATVSFRVNGHVKSPYKHMAFSDSSTSPTAQHLFHDSPCIITLATDSLMARLQDVAVLKYDPNYIIEFSKTATEEEIKEVLSTLEQKGKVCSIDELIEATERELSDTIKKTLPSPLFLLIAAIVAYLSTDLLILRKKSRELAYYYLCGLNRSKCAVITLAANCIISLPALILNSIFVILAPEYDWLRSSALSGLSVTTLDFVMIVAYYLLTVLVSLLVTYSSMARHTPLTYLRGVE